MYNINRDRTTRRLVHSLLVTVTFAYARGLTDVVLGGRGGEGDTSTPAGGREGLHLAAGTAEAGPLHRPQERSTMLARAVPVADRVGWHCLLTGEDVRNTACLPRW